jgi:hypothetical protein
MEKYVALIGAVGLISFTLVSVSLLVNFFIKGFYVYSYKLALKSQDGDHPLPFDIGDLFSECEEQKVWLCLLWQRPMATLLACTTIAAGIRADLGLSVTLGSATLVFLLLGVLLPRVLPSMPAWGLIKRQSTTATPGPSNAAPSP